MDFEYLNGFFLQIANKLTLTSPQVKTMYRIYNSQIAKTKMSMKYPS